MRASGDQEFGLTETAHHTPSPRSSPQYSRPALPLLPILKEEIDAAGGAISFARFMELALYHPEHGYYASGRAGIGREGDFFTSVSVGRIYGRLHASIAREVWEHLERPPEFTLVEQGAHDGTLAADILESITCEKDAFSAALRYVIVEPLSINRSRQKARLGSFDALETHRCLSWVHAIEELPRFSGMHLSNELLDAFPVHSLRWDGRHWLEECVGENGEELFWRTRPITDPELRRVAASLPRSLPGGFRVEVNSGLKPWLWALHDRMQQGVILTVDYGQSGEDRYAPHRADGTLLAYQSHERFDDPLGEPGLRDITAQVDFTALAIQARETGFEILGYSDQHHFLVSTAEPWLRSLGDSKHGAFTEEKQRDLRALQTLLHPGIMGRQFKAIAFGKNFGTIPLSCFRHQRPGIAALGSI